MGSSKVVRSKVAIASAVASRKAAVVRGVAHGLISQSEALARYRLSEEEFAGWVRAVAEHGQEALKTTALKKYRQPKVD